MTTQASPAADPPPAPARVAAFAEPGVLQRVACAVFAWAVTVAPAAFSRTGDWTARLLAVATVAAGIAGPATVPFRRRLGRHIGISAFCAAAVGVWVLSPEVIDVARMDAVRAGIGGVAWGLYAFSWGEPWRFRTEAPQDDAGGALRARATLPPLAVPIAAFGVFASIAVLGTAWLTREPSRALLGHAAAVGIAVAMVTATAQIATSRGKSRRMSSGSLPKQAVRAIVLLLVVAALGAVRLILQG